MRLPLSMVLLVAFTHSLSAAELSELALFTSGAEGYHTFRIPAIIRGSQGTLLAFCEGRKNGRSDSGDIDVVLKRSTDGGETWSKLVVVAEDGEHTVGNPCPVVDRDTGRIWLPLTRNDGSYTEAQNKQNAGAGSRGVLLCYSDDEGATWSKPEDITKAVKRDDWTWYATGPGNGIQLKSGRLLIPCDHRRQDTHETYSHFIFSDDHGKSWQIGGVADAKTNECQAVELDDGRVLLNMRSYYGQNRRAIALSDDGGKTLGKLTRDDALLEPVCQASLIRLVQDDKPSLYIFANPASTKREKLTIRLSKDNCQTWSATRELYGKSSAYSSLVDLGGGRIGCLYEKDNYKTLSLAVFDIAWLNVGGENLPRPAAR